MYDGDSDTLTVTAVLSGNSEAYGDIVHRYKNVVFGVIYAIVKNHHTAEDLTQDTFVDGYIKLKTLNEPSSIGAWLIKIAKNKCYNYMTRSALRFESELDEFIQDALMSSPENYVIDKQERTDLMNAVRRLPELYRTVIEMYYFKNYPQNKIAEVLNIPLGTVSRRLYYARTKLKKELDIMEETIKNVNFEAEVAKKIKSLRDYYHLHNFSSDGIEKEVDNFIKFIETIPESKLKHSAYAEAYRNSDKEEYKSKIEQEAILGENADVHFDMFFEKYANKNDDKKWLEAIDGDDGIAKMEKMANSDEVVGKMYFWRGACNIRLKNFAEARVDFEKSLTKLRRDDSYYPNAVAAIKAIDIIAPEFDEYITGYSITGESYRLYDGGKRLDFVNQPGFSEVYPGCGVNSYHSLYYYASNGGIDHNNWFYDLSKHTEKESVSVVAGTFEDCLHIHIITKDDWARSAEYEIWYAKDIGLVKFRVKVDGDDEECYELCEYKINGGSGYMPAEVGNLWRYRNVNLSEPYEQTNEYEITSVVDNPETDSKYIYTAATNILRTSKKDSDSNTYIALAQDALPNEEPQKWDFDTAILDLKLANQKNTSARASQFSHNAIDFIGRCAEYYKNRYVFLPSGISSGVISKHKTDDKIFYKENSVYYMGPYVIWGSWYGARRCIGLKPFRFLNQLAGTLYSDKWIVGYTEEIANGDGTVYLKVEDGGTIGAFDNCIKVTFDLEWEGGKDDRGYYLHNLRYSHCGTKIYWYAPNVGIVRHDCIWGDAITSSIELTEYKSCATNGEYMPIYVGNRWIYDEVTLPEQFIARKKYDLVSGIEDDFFMIEEQEMLFLGTDEEYEAFQATREK